MLNLCWVRYKTGGKGSKGAARTIEVPPGGVSAGANRLDALPVIDAVRKALLDTLRAEGLPETLVQSFAPSGTKISHANLLLKRIGLENSVLAQLAEFARNGSRPLTVRDYQTIHAPGSSATWDTYRKVVSTSRGLSILVHEMLHLGWPKKGARNIGWGNLNEAVTMLMTPAVLPKVLRRMGWSKKAASIAGREDARNLAESMQNKSTYHHLADQGFRSIARTLGADPTALARTLYRISDRHRSQALAIMLLKKQGRPVTMANIRSVSPALYETVTYGRTGLKDSAKAAIYKKFKV